MPDCAGQRHIPRRIGLHAEYLATQLRGFKTGAWQDLDGRMASAAQPLAEKDIVDVVGYLAGLNLCPFEV